MRARRFVAVAAVTAAIMVVTAMIGLATNVASGAGRWPAWLEPVRDYPWPALAVLTVLAVLLGMVAALVAPTMPPAVAAPRRANDRGQHDVRAEPGGEPAANSAVVGGSSRLGAPIDRYTPLMLEVHPAIEVPGGADRLPPLPTYVSRPHDARLRQIVDDVAAGRTSRMIVLVGGSSTGKTRACWEAIQALPDRWWLWHPIDPSRPGAAARELGHVGPYTVVWLNEAQHYLLTADRRLAERVCAGLRSLLRDPDRGPVLVLTTMWPEHWGTLTGPARPGAPDPYAQARELLANPETTDEIIIPARFTAVDLPALREAAGGDLRLRQAAEQAEDGGITQHLAGVPELLRRYRNAPPGALAVIDAAIDARRLGHPVAISCALLTRAAPGYLTDVDWERAGDDWLEQALAYATQPCHGVPGPLSRIKPRPGEARSAAQPHYRLADYLEQTGRDLRADGFPSATFWEAAADAVLDPGVLHRLGEQAQRRGRYHRAIQLYLRAADGGDTGALCDLAYLRQQAGDSAGAQALYQQAANRGDSRALWELAVKIYRVADDESAVRLAVQLANPDTADAALWVVATHWSNDRGFPFDDTESLRALAARSADLGDYQHAVACVAQAADDGDTGALELLDRLREHAGKHEEVEELYRDIRANEANTHGNSDPAGVARLVKDALDHDIASARAAQDADLSDLLSSVVLDAYLDDDSSALAYLIQIRELHGDHEGATALAVQTAELGARGTLVYLMSVREELGDHTGATACAVYIADRGEPRALRYLAEIREEAGDRDGAEDLYRQAADRGDTNALSHLMRRRTTGDRADLARLCLRAANRGHAAALQYLAELGEEAGNPADADKIRRFGLDDDGSPAAPFPPA